jgi:hypothetical protein
MAALCECSFSSREWRESVEMVSTIDITKMTVRDRVVVDLEVRMQDPDDHDFQPRAHLDGSTLCITNKGHTDQQASKELDDEILEACEKDRFVELRIKFSVEGMHGVLNHSNPIVMDGKAKKLAEPRWKTIVPLQ